MLKLRGPVVLQLRHGELFRCEQACAVRVVRGRVWITRSGDLDDHFLEAGHTLVLDRGTRTLIGAEGDAQVALQATPSRLGALRQRLLRSGGATPGATIAAWNGPPTQPT